MRRVGLGRVERIDMTNDLGFHWGMLNDPDRNSAYRAAIRRAAPGRVVYDLGAGVGPMSYYALASGARRVYGFEVDPDVYPYLRQLKRRFENFVPIWTDIVNGRLPKDPPDVVVCEMWSTWLTDWPMVKALRRILHRTPAARVIPACGYHVLQLVQARHRSGMPIQLVPGTEAAVFDQPFATSDMSLPALACVTEFRHRIPPIDVVVSVIPLATGTANAIRLYSYEEVSAGHILPRLGTRSDEMLRWITPLSVRRGRRVRVRIRHRWDTDLKITVVPSTR
jgi:predicted RNA methylase